METESPSQLSPAVIQRMWTSSTAEALRKLGRPVPAMTVCPPRDVGPERMCRGDLTGRCDGLESTTVPHRSEAVSGTPLRRAVRADTAEEAAPPATREAASRAP